MKRSALPKVTRCTAGQCSSCTARCQGGRPSLLEGDGQTRRLGLNVRVVATPSSPSLSTPSRPPPQRFGWRVALSFLEYFIATSARDSCCPRGWVEVVLQDNSPLLGEPECRNTNLQILSLPSFPPLFCSCFSLRCSAGQRWGRALDTVFLARPWWQRRRTNAFVCPFSGGVSFKRSRLPFPSLLSPSPLFCSCFSSSCSAELRWGVGHWI